MLTFYCYFIGNGRAASAAIDRVLIESFFPEILPNFLVILGVFDKFHSAFLAAKMVFLLPMAVSDNNLYLIAACCAS